MLVPSAQIPGGALQLTNWGPTRSVSAFVCNLNVFGFFQIQKKIKTGLKTNMGNMVTIFEPWDLFSNNLEITFNFCHYRQQFDASFPGFILQRGLVLSVDTVDGWRVVASLMQLTAIVTANNTNTVCLSTVNCFLFSNCIWPCNVC